VQASGSPAHAFLEEVESGHAGRTMQLVEALRRSRSDGALKACDFQPADLRAAIEREGSAVGRNRLVRRLVAEKREGFAALVLALGLVENGVAAAAVGSEPAPGRRKPEDVDEAACGRRQQQQQPVSGRGAVDAPVARGERPGQQSQHAAEGTSRHCRGTAIFDFDQTLTVRHVGPFEDLTHVVKAHRVFGGPERTEMLQRLFEQLQTSHVVIALVTRNSRHVVGKALHHAGLLEYMSKELMFGFEDYGDEVPKSTVVLDRILPALGLEQNRAIFIDDDRGNMKDMQSCCPGAALIHCPRVGLGGTECGNIVAWADNL